MKSYKRHQCETMGFKGALNWLRICKGMAHKVAVSYQNPHSKNTKMEHRRKESNENRGRETENKKKRTVKSFE